MLPWMEQLSIFLRILMIIQSFPSVNISNPHFTNIQRRYISAWVLFLTQCQVMIPHPLKTQDRMHWNFLEVEITENFYVSDVYPNIHRSVIARTWKQPRCPSADERIRKLWYIYTMEYHSAIKKNTFESVLMRWMKLEPIIQREARKTRIQCINTYICNLEGW